MPIYNFNNRTYDIPDNLVKEFEKDNPTATMAYQDGEDIYDIQVNQRDEFLKQFPNAKLYIEQPTDESKKVGDVYVGGIGTQEEADAIFDANAKAIREKHANQKDQGIPESEMQRLRDIKDKAQAEIDSSSFFDRFFDSDTRAAVAARNQAEEALETYEEANREKETWFDKNVMGVISGFADKVGDLSTWDFGASGWASGVALNDAITKMENGGQLTTAEQNMLDAFGLASAVQSAYQDKVGMAYRVGGSLPESMAFGASLAINPLGRVGAKVAETAAKAAVKKYGASMVSKLAKGAARVGGDVVGMAGVTATTGAGRVAEDYYNRLNGQTTFDIDENGIVRYGGQVEQEEADDAIWKAMGSSFIENYSEAMGNYFAPMGTMISNLTSKGLKAAHLGKFADMVNDISSSQFSKGLQRFKEATKFDGLVGEYLEEVAGNVMNAATVGDMNFNSPEDPRSVFNPETNIETFLSCALMSGSIYAVEAPISMYNKNVAKKNLGNADKEASELWGDRWEDMRSQMDEADPQYLAQLLTGVQNATDLTEEQKAAAKNYGMRLMQYQGYNARRLQNQAESTDEANEINNAYDRGADAVNPADKHNAKTAMDKAEAVLADDPVFLQEVINGQDNPVATITAMVESGKYSEDQIAKAKDYYVAYRRMNGLTDAVLDRVNSQIESANKEVDANTNVDENTGTRTIIPVTLRDGRQGYVIKGTITPGEEGGIDINKSDSYIVVRVDGKNLPMNPNKDLVSVGQITTPEILKEYNGTQLREQLINQEIGEIDWNPATPNPKVGDSFEMDGVTVTIVSHDGQGGMFVVPTDQWQAAQGNEKQTQKLVMQAQQAGVVPASMFKQWASDQLDAQEEAVAVQQEVASGEAVGEQVNAGVNNSETPNGSNLSPVEDKHPMTEDEAASFIFQMEANAEPIPEIEFTPENWKAAFGENGTIETPIGTVKMGENQISKLFLKKRTKEFGMIAPTLSNPDIIIEEFSRAKEGESERESSYLFIKTFIKDGQKVRYYTSVTVLQEGMEVSISSHVLGEKQVPKKLMEGNVIYIKEALLSNSSDGHLAEQPNAVPDLLPTQESNAPLSTNKDSKKNVQSQEKEQKPFHEREKEDVFRELGEMYGDKMPHKVEVTAKALADDVVKAQKKLDDAQEKLDNAPIGRDSKQKEARDKAQQELDAIKIEANFWNEMDADIKKAQAEREAMLNPKVEVNMSEEPMDASEFVAQQLANGNITLTSESFKKETGYGEAERKKFMKIIRKAENGGMTIEEAGERLMEMDRENGTNFFDQSDPNAGRDAIINMLGMARTWGDIANYIRDNRQRQAESDVEGIRSEMEEAIWNAYHVTPEEYATMLEMEMQENPYEGVDLAALDAIFAEKEFGEEQKSEENESGTDVEGNQGQSELLSEEQPGDTTGDQPGETVKQDEGIGGGTPVEGETPQAGSSVGRGINVFAEAERIDKEERRRKPLRERAREWSNALGVKVNFLESIDDVDAQTRAQIKAEHANGSGVPGWVAPSGEVYFFMPDLQDIKDIDETYIHEVVAHIGMEKLLGKERFAELCDKVWEMMPQSEKYYYENEYPGVKEIKDKTKRHRRAADEYIAHLAEKENLTPEERTIWDQIVQFFRESLDKALNGIIGKSQITNEDISNLIKASYANLKKEAGKDITSQIEKARNEVDLDPTDAQKEAGNYKKGHVKIDGYDITIENPKGGTRSGTDKNGKEWSITMNNDYGYIRGTEAVDGDHIDVFLSDSPTEGNVFVVDQTNEDGTFDESKIMYGFNSLEEARAAYLSNYEEGWESRIMAITEVPKDEFKKWIDSSHRKTKAFSEYKNIKVAPSIEETNVSRMADIEARILEIEGRRNEISDELAEIPAYDVMKVAELRAEEWDLGQEQSELEAEYSGLRAMNDESNAILEEEGSELRFSAKKKRALETASVSSKKHQPTVVSSADGAKILNNLDNLAREYEGKSSQSKTFLGDVAKAINARKQGSGSQYSTFETVNGKVVTIRLADHNAKVSNFDNREESEGISIVISAKDNNGITNDGNAHIVEYFYDSIDLRRADGKPLAEIVKSLKQALYSGEFKDTTGLAERQEVNPSRFRVVKDKSGRKSLVGLHNISEEKLRKAIKQGGLANPSMAVIDMNKQKHVDYGDITLIAPESLVDKKTGKNVGTYMADAYTPIYPTVAKKMSDKGAKAFTKELGTVDETFRSKVRTYFNSYLDNGTMYDALFYWYLSDTGKNPPILEAALPEGFTREEIGKVKAVNPNAHGFFDLSDEEKQEVVKLYAERFYGNTDGYKKHLEEYIEKWESPAINEVKFEMVRRSIQSNLRGIKEYGYEYDYVSGYYSRVMALAERQSKPSDVETFRNAYNEVVKNGLEEDFGNWLMAKEEELGVKEKLFAGYDNQGRAKYVPNTLLNASKLMKKEGRAGATGLGGFNYFVAILAPVAKNTKQIIAKKQNLSTQEEYDNFAKKWGDHYHRLALQLQPGADKWADYGYHRLHEIAPMANPKDYVKKEYGLELSDKFIKDLNDVKNAIKNDFPARYFETKFERPVYLNEFAAAVVPQGTSKDVVDALTEVGIPIEEYESGNNEARMAAVDKVTIDNEGVRFRFIGERGARNLDKAEEATTRLDNLAVAREMEAAEKDAKTIKMATGWERGADGLWRYEVDDVKVKDISETQRHLGNGEKLELKDVLTEDSYRNLITEYPKASKLKFYAEDFDEYGGGYFIGNKIVIHKDYIWNDDFLVRTIIHELQHAIQGYEGFDSGTDPEEMKDLYDEQNSNIKTASRIAISIAYQIRKKADRLIKNRKYRYKTWAVRSAIGNLKSRPGYEWGGVIETLARSYSAKELKTEYESISDSKRLMGRISLNDKEAESLYMRSSGEVEARNAERRMTMPTELRRNILALETEDVAREDQIFLKDGIESGMRFRLSEKGKQIQAEVDKFTSKYNSKEVVLVDSEMTDGELEDTMPFTTAKRIRKEIKEGILGGYLPNTDKIYIFVDNQELDDLEDTLFHENMHAIFGETNIPNEFNEASKDKFKTLREVIRSNYPEKKWAEEVFVNVAANAMVNNDFKFIDKYLPEVYREEFYIKLKEFGYETEQEIRRRIVVGNTSSESGAQSEKRQAMEESDGGSRKSESTEQTERLRQLFDQVADMGLEGVLGNKEYASLMTDIYKALPEDVRLGVAESASKNYNGNVAPAVSDYLNHAEASIWDKVVAIIRDALRKIGFDVDLNANDVKYILWRSKKPLDRRNVLDVAEDIDAIRRFRITGSITRFKSKKKDNFDVSDKRDKLLKEYDAFLKTGKFNFIEAFQDRMYSLKVLMDKVVEVTGKKVRDYEDAYKAENQLGSINKPMQEKYLKNFYKPLLEVMKTLSDKYGREVVERYIYCKSGLERNVVLRQRDADEAYNSSKAELDEKLAKNEIDQAQYNILLQQAEDQRQKTLSEDVDYSGIRGMLFNVKAQAIQKEYEEGKIDKNTRDARLNQLEANRSTVVKDWKKFAEDQVAALEGPGKASKAELDALWDKINAATNETLRMDYESGMIDQDTYNAEKNMMKYYVPLRNWDDTTAEEMYEYRSDLVRPVSSNQKRAKGRESQADNPIATIGLMAQSAIVRGNRNKVKQKFYAFVANRETSLATVRDVWYVKDPSTGDWTPQYADTTSAKDSAEFDAIIEQFEANMKALEEQGQAFRGKLPLGMKFKASTSQKKAHVVPVMINGVEYAVYVNGNPRAAQAINGETNNESVKSTSEWIDKLKRLYGAGLTSWNPDFIIPNLVRDTIHASTMTMLDAGPMAAIKYMFNTPKMFWNVGKMVTGLGKANPKLEAYFKEFVDNGGETGYTAINTLEDYKKEYDKLIDEAKGIKASAGKNVKKAFEAIAKVLEAANRIAEDVNRFNAYVSARESGETIMRSVDAAKNITVNFNRKGALSANNTAFGTVANAMSKWILFFNPAVQGIAQIVTKSKMNPKRAASMGVTILASGFMMPMLNEMLVAASGDDEEDNYWNQSDYKRRNNWMLFTGDGYITFPLPPILRELYGIGDVMYGALTGHISAERAAMDIARQVQSAVGFFNLIPEVSQEPDMVTYAKGFAPDLAAPILDIISNTNFMGRPIAKWTDFNEYDPEYERVYKGTSKHWVELSMLLNELGGNEGRRSDLWGNFINPAMMEHLITSYGGGIGKTINNLVGMALAEGEDNVDPFRKTPIIPRFYTPNDEKTVVPGINRKYYDYNYKYNVTKKALKNYQEGIESGEHPEWQKYIDEMKQNNEIEFINYFKAMDKKLKKLQNLLKGNPTNKEKLEEQIVDLKAMVSAKSWEILN